MSLTPEQVKDIESKASRYGCGVESCLACYPLQYACDYCLEAFETPIANGEAYECEQCAYSPQDSY